MTGVLTGALAPYPALFAQWEAGQWSAGAIDFRADRADWVRLTDRERDALGPLFCMIHLGEAAVVDDLPPLLVAAATPEKRMLLAAQLADEARHLAFMDRFADEVLGLGPTPDERAARAREHVSSGYQAIFEEFLGVAAEALEAAPADRPAAVRLVTCYHLLVEGAFGLVAQPRILRALERRSILPGFREGFSYVARDEHRHVAFGVAMLRDAIRTDPGAAQTVHEAVADLADAWRRLTAPPDVAGFFEALDTTQEEFAAESLRWLGRRLDTLGLRSRG